MTFLHNAIDNVVDTGDIIITTTINTYKIIETPELPNLMNISLKYKYYFDILDKKTYYYANGLDYNPYISITPSIILFLGQAKRKFYLNDDGNKQIHTVTGGDVVISQQPTKFCISKKKSEKKSLTCIILTCKVHTENQLIKKAVKKCINTLDTRVLLNMVLKYDISDQLDDIAAAFQPNDLNLDQLTDLATLYSTNEQYKDYYINICNGIRAKMHDDY